MEKKYMARLMALSANQLFALKAHLSDTKTRKNGAFMIQCVVAALLMKTGLEA